MMFEDSNQPPRPAFWTPASDKPAHCREEHALLAEYFPAKIRYTSVSVPYHIGNGWGGGLVPFITTAAYQATGSLGYALIYPIAVPAVCFVLSLFLMPETRQNRTWEPEAAKA
jgi:hypothetical protein